jgi:fumarate hydratase class I
MGADWCPPGMLSLGIGGSPEKAMLLAKWGMMDPVDIQELIARGPSSRAEELRLELDEKVNALGIGAQGLGGLSTVLDVKVNEYPTHAVSKPVALLPNCAATRHVHFTLDGSGPARLDPPSLEDWPRLALDMGSSKRVDLATLTKAGLAQFKAGDRLLLSGKILTARDAAHKRLVDMMARGEKLPVDLANRFVYYVGPVEAVRDEAVGPAGPTTSSRMDRFVEPLLANAGLMGMIGKSERGPGAIESIRKHGALYCIAVGGAAYLVSKAIRASRMVAFEDLGMEAIREFEVKDMPVIVAVDPAGNAIHKTGPAQWRARIGKIPVAVV